MWKPQSCACALVANMPVTAAIQPSRIGLFWAIAGRAQPGGEAGGADALDDAAAPDPGKL